MTLSAQTEKRRLDGGWPDRYQCGGSLQPDQFSPNAGVHRPQFCNRRQSSVRLYPSGNTKSTDFGIGPLHAVYFTSGTVKPLLQAAI